MGRVRRLVMQRLVYGPVPSRRFGRSLGVDVVPFKSCTLDCLYCQLGRTDRHSTERRMFVPPDAVVEQVLAAAAGDAPPDVITFAGSGEPTLYAGLGEVARRLREVTAIPLLLITNGTLLWREDVAAEAALFDRVAPSLDAGDEETFRRINRPAAEVTLERLVEGIAAFTRRYPEKVRLEIFIARGLNDSPAAIDAIVETVRRIDPVRVELNTAVRPTADRSVQGVSEAFLQSLVPRFHCPAEAIASFSQATTAVHDEAPEVLARRVLTTLGRRPCTVDDLHRSLGASSEAVSGALVLLVKTGKVYEEEREGRVYFRRRQADGGRDGE
jgi:wyosine [tRNA(Phe)-imidazoG37] synthetase (radical SAM superfamily)